MEETNETDRINRQIGITIKKLRIQRGMTLIALGVAVGVTYQQVQKYERGVSRISAAMLIKFAEALSVESSHLLPGAMLIPRAYARSLSSNRDNDNLIRYFSCLKPQQKLIVIQLLKSMAQTAPTNES